MLRSVFLIAAIMAPGLALAEEPALDARALGIAEAIFAYCSKVNPADASKYRVKVDTVAHGASDQVLARVRQSDVYQRAHQSVDDFVAKVDEHNAMKVCTESLAKNK